MEKPLLLIIIMTAGSVADQLTPDNSNINGLEGDRQSLQCSYTTSNDYIDLYWYRQYPNEAPQYILYKGARSRSSYKNIPDSRFDSTTSRTSTELIITNLTLADSALYYCALRSYVLVYTWTADKLTFGKAITLTVSPKDPQISLPVMSILELSGGQGPEVCLAESFSDTSAKMKVTANGISEEHEVSKAVLSTKSRNYYFAYFESKIENCSLLGRVADRQKETDVQPVIPAKEQVTYDKLDCDVNNTISQESVESSKEKMNFMSLLVTGLRIVFAKAVAINVLMTVKVLVL